MIHVTAPIRFSHPEGHPKRWRELRHRFRQSATAIHLVDSCVKNGVELKEATNDLQRKGLGGDFDTQYNRVRYSKRSSPLIVFHEMRHAERNDALQNAGLSQCYSSPNLRMVFLAVAVEEADAWYVANKIGREMQGATPIDPFDYFARFTHEAIDQWFVRRALVAFDNVSIKTIFSPLSLPGGLCSFIEEKYDRWAMPKSKPYPISQEQDQSNKIFLRDYIDVVCRNPDETNYMFHDKSEDDKNAIATVLYENIFSAEREKVLAYFHRKCERLHRAKTAYATVYNFMSHIPAL